MFNHCYKLKKIKGINNFITNKVINMEGMFQLCYKLNYLDLSNFDTANCINMSWMFNHCDELKYLNLLNFKVKHDADFMLSFEQKEKCEFISNNKDLQKLFKLKE